MFETIKLALLAFTQTMNAFKFAAETWTKFQDAKWREELSLVTEKLEKGDITSEDRKELARKLAALTERL